MAIPGAGSSSAFRLPQYIPKVATVSVPAPTGGWNARDSLDAMDQADAINIVNLFPTFGAVSRRNGYTKYATGLGGGVKTLAEYTAVAVRKLIAAANGKFFDVSSPGAVGAPLATGFTSDAWQQAQYQNAGAVNDMVFVNGVDAPQIYNGSSITAATISGSGLTITNLLGATVFKTRVFYWENASQNLWYTAEGAIAGTLTAFPLGQLTGFGGNIQFIATWSFSGGAGPEDYCIIGMSTGDIIMYTGTDITDAANWALVGIFRIGAPIGTRCYMKLGPDLAIINKNGFVPLSQVLPALFNPSEALSNKIVFAAQQAAQLYGSNFGWQPLLYPLGNMAIFNVPISSTVFAQYVMNTATGAWTQFNNQNALCWSLFEDQPYFGGTDGNVYQADNGGADNGGAIAVSAQTAWNYFGDRSRLKRLCFIRPSFQSDQAISLGFDVGTDFQNPSAQPPTSSFSSSGTPWNTSPWGSPWSPSAATYLPRIIANGVGNNFSTEVAANLLNASFTWYSLAYQYEPGLGI